MRELGPSIHSRIECPEMMHRFAMQLRSLTHFRIRGVVALMAFAAVFFAGYRNGLKESSVWRFRYLIELIESTVVPSEWEQLGGGPLTYPNEPFTVVCVAEVAEKPAEEDSIGERSEK